MIRHHVKHFARYFGILNGIDTAIWNPATDAFLPTKFDGNYFLPHRVVDIPFCTITDLCISTIILRVDTLQL